MKYTRLYTGNDGQSHFEALTMALEDAPIGKIAQSSPVEAAFFGYIDDETEVPWHNPPCSQYVIMLKGAMEIEVGSGVKKTFQEGEIVLADDTTGQGHITRAASNGPRHYLVLPVKV